MRSPIQLDRPEDAAKIAAALARPLAKAWQRQRLQAMHMAAQGKWTLQQIGDAVGAGRSTVAVWLKLVRTQGFEALLRWKEGQGAPSKLSAQIQAALQAGLVAGRWRRARDLLLWLDKEHGIKMGLGGAYYYLGKAGGVLKVPRKTHAKKDAAQAELFKADLAERLHALPLEAGRLVRVWVADEHRYGLISVLRRCWGLRGARVTAPYQTNTPGAICTPRWRSMASTPRKRFSAAASIWKPAASSWSKSRRAIRRRSTSSFGIKRAFIHAPAMPPYRRVCICFPCRPTALSSTRWKRSGPSSKTPCATKSGRRWMPSKPPSAKS